MHIKILLALVIPFLFISTVSAAELKGSIEKLFVCPSDAAVCIDLFSERVDGRFILRTKRRAYRVRTRGNELVDGVFSKRGIKAGRYRIVRMKADSGENLNIVDPETRKIRIKKGKNYLPLLVKSAE